MWYPPGWEPPGWQPEGWNQDSAAPPRSRSRVVRKIERGSVTVSDDYGSYVCGGQGPDYVKDPHATTDYEFNWRPELDGDTISSSAFLLPDGLTEVSSSNTTRTATIFVSGGSVGRVYRITNRVTTAGGRTWDQTIRVLVREQ